MPDHFHMLIQPLCDEKNEYFKLARIMNSLKRYSSHKIKELLDRRLLVWQESYRSTSVRGGSHFEETMEYITENPAKAGLLARWYDYEYVWTPGMKSIKRDDLLS